MVCLTYSILINLFLLCNHLRLGCMAIIILRRSLYAGWPLLLLFRGRTTIIISSPVIALHDITPEIVLGRRRLLLLS